MFAIIVHQNHDGALQHHWHLESHSNMKQGVFQSTADTYCWWLLRTLIETETIGAIMALIMNFQAITLAFV